MNELRSIQRYFIMSILPLIENRFGKMIHEIPEIKDEFEKWQRNEMANVVFMRILSDWLDKQEY